MAKSKELSQLASLLTVDTGQVTLDAKFAATAGTAQTDFVTKSQLEVAVAGKDNTDEITEGSTNLYYTTARANTDFDTRLATKSTTNLAEGTNLYFTDARAQSALSGTSPSLTNVTLSGYLRGPANFTIDPSAHGDNTGTVIIAGNLQVDGTTTTVNSTTVTVNDLNLVLANNAATAGEANGAGISIGPIGSILSYVAATDTLSFGKWLNPVTQYGTGLVRPIITSVDATASAEPSLHLQSGSSTKYDYYLGIYRGDSSSYAYFDNRTGTGNTYFQIGGSNKVTISSSGLAVSGGISAATSSSAIATFTTNDTAQYANAKPWGNGIVIAGGASNTSYGSGLHFDIGGGGGRASIYTSRGGSYGGTLHFAVDTGANPGEPVEIARITSGGLYGIGTQSPSSKLHVRDSGTLFYLQNTAATSNNLFTGSDSTGWYMEQGGGTGNEKAIRIQSQNGSNSYAWLKISGADSTLQFSTSNTEAFRVDSSRTILVNTTVDPTYGSFPRPRISIKQAADSTAGYSAMHWEASGDESVLGLGYNGSEWAFSTSYRSTGNYRPIAFHTTGVRRLYISNGANGGKIGINTNTPINLLDVNDSSSGIVASFRSNVNTSGASAGIGLYATSNAGTNWYGSEIRSINTQSNPDYLNPRLGFFTQNTNTYLASDITEKVSILGNGFTGINTTAPLARLEVNGTAGKANIRIADGNHDYDAATYYYPAISYYARRDGGRFNGDPLTAGTGSTGSIVFTDRPGTAGYPTACRSSDIQFYTATNNYNGGLNPNPNLVATMTADGRVGIGLSNPSNPLHVYAVYPPGSIAAKLQTTADTWLQLVGGTTSWQIGATGNGLELYNDNTTAYRVSLTSTGKLGVSVRTPFSNIQSGSPTFDGGNGMYSNERVGISNHGNLTGLMLASTYNSDAYPEYGLVFVQGPSTSNYNVWSVSPDGPAKGNGLNFIYGNGASNIHTVAPRAGVKGTGTYALYSSAGIKVGRSVLNWFQWGGNPSGAYLHIKTNLWGGGAPGNSYPTMSLFHIKGYTYDAQTIDSMIGFHNWSNYPYNLRTSNAGSFAAAQGVYMSSDGYVVLVIYTGTNYPGIVIDYHQSYPYTWLDVQISGYTSSSSTTGVY